MYFINSSSVRRFLLSDLENNFPERLHMMKSTKRINILNAHSTFATNADFYRCFRRLRRSPRSAPRSRSRPDDARRGAEAAGGGDGRPGPGQGLLHHPPGQPGPVPARRGDGEYTVHMYSPSEDNNNQFVSSVSRSAQPALQRPLRDINNSRDIWCLRIYKISSLSAVVATKMTIFYWGARPRELFSPVYTYFACVSGFTRTVYKKFG